MGLRHPVERFTTSPFTYDRNFPIFADAIAGDDGFKQASRPADVRTVTIEHDVWIGKGCLLAGGITIGTGAVVAARSVVTRDVPPYSICAGSPATVRKMRFPEVTVQALLASDWFRYDLKSLEMTADASIEDFLRLFNYARDDGKLPRIERDPPFQDALRLLAI